MAVKVVNGSVIDATEEIIAHQVNCQGVMGSGVADGIKKKYPQAFAVYTAECSSKNKKGSALLGTCLLVETRGKIIANLFGQEFYGRDKKVYTDHVALSRAFSTLADYARHNDFAVAMPYGIGCGLGGGDWELVSDLISEAFIGVEVRLYKWRG